MNGANDAEKENLISWTSGFPTETEWEWLQEVVIIIIPIPWGGPYTKE